MPPILLCVNHEHCKGVAVNGTKYCQYCLDVQREAKNRWRWAGWSRVDERKRLQGNKK